MINGYREIAPQHAFDSPKANGMVYEHRSVAARILDRELLDEEIVHHIDEDRSNNHPDNLIVFRSSADHIAHHHGGELIAHDDGTYSSTRLDSVCSECQVAISTKQIYCGECYNRIRSEHLPDKGTLKRLIWEKPVIKIAEQFGVSDVAVHKWCKKYEIEKPPRGHWLKL